MKTKNKLTPKQSMFCKEYLIDLNATQSAIRAGYSKKTAGRIGQENLQKPVIQAEIQKSLGIKSNKLEITSDRILEEVARVAYINQKDFYGENGELKPIHELEDDIARAIHSVESGKYRIHDKMKALELLGKYKKLFTEKVDHKHTGNFTLRYGHRDKPREQ